MDTIDELRERIRRETDRIVRGGREIRERIGRLTADAAAQFHQTAEGLAAIAHAVADGSIQAAREALPAEGDSRLRDVVAGLADGFRTAAEAVDLTLQESAAEGRRFADEDLQKARADLQSVAVLFTEATGEFATRLKSATREGANSLREHAERAYQQSRPSFEGALARLWTHLGEVGREAGGAGLAAGKSAAGTLFAELGERLARLGETLGGSRPD